MKHIYTTSWHQFNWKHRQSMSPVITHYEHQNCTWVISIKFRQLYPQKKDMLTTTVRPLWRSYKTSSLNQGMNNPANESMENARIRQMDDLEAPGRYKWLRSRRSNFNNWRSLQLNVPSKPHKIPFLCNRAGVVKLGPSTAAGYSHIPAILRFNSIGF
jgi:hypothetical protein